MISDHDPWAELAAGHALGALEPEDEQAFLDHLRGCDRCARELAGFHDVGAHLAYAADAATPPPDLGRRILDAASAERPAVFAPAPPAVPRGARVGAVGARRWGGAPWGGAAGGAGGGGGGAAAVVLGFGAWNVTLRADSQAKREAIARRNAALRCLGAPDTATYRLTSTGADRATACLDGADAYLVVDHLDPTSPSSAYVLWWVDRDRGPHAVNRFDVSSDGTAVFEIPLPVRPDDVTAMAVSLEPRRGDLPTAPTRQIVAGTART